MKAIALVKSSEFWLLMQFSLGICSVLDILFWTLQKSMGSHSAFKTCVLQGPGSCRPHLQADGHDPLGKYIGLLPHCHEGQIDGRNDASCDGTACCLSPQNHGKAWVVAIPVAMVCTQGATGAF